MQRCNLILSTTRKAEASSNGILEIAKNQNTRILYASFIFQLLHDSNNDQKYNHTIVKSHLLYIDYKIYWRYDPLLLAQVSINYRGVRIDLLAPLFHFLLLLTIALRRKLNQQPNNCCRIWKPRLWKRLIFLKFDQRLL